MKNNIETLENAKSVLDQIKAKNNPADKEIINELEKNIRAADELIKKANENQSSKEITELKKELNKNMQNPHQISEQNTSKTSKNNEHDHNF